MSLDDSAFIEECAKAARRAFFAARSLHSDESDPPPWEMLTQPERWMWMAAARAARFMREPR